MTEAEWWDCSDAEAMLEWLRERASPRKLRLFAVTALLRLPALLEEGHGRAAATVAEWYAEGRARDADLQPFRNVDPRSPLSPANAVAAESAYQAAFLASVFATGRASHFIGTRSYGRPGEVIAQADPLRDLFRGPVALPARDRRWLTPTALSLAAAAYDERVTPSGKLDAARLAVLSDALEEAGCADEAVLSHLRSAGRHVRGCWALDLVLGKS